MCPKIESKCEFEQSCSKLKEGSSLGLFPSPENVFLPFPFQLKPP